MMDRCKATYEAYVTAFQINARQLLGEAIIDDRLAPAITRTLTPRRCQRELTHWCAAYI